MDWHESAVVYAGRKDIRVIRHDPYKKLVWVGDSEGYVSSYYGKLLLPYTSFQAHTGAVNDLAVSESAVYSLSEKGLKIHKRTGMVIASSAEAGGRLLLLVDGGEVLVGSDGRVNRYIVEQSNFYVKETGTFMLEDIGIKDVSLEFLARAPPYLVLGLSNGRAQVVDPMTFDSVLDKPLTCHTGPLTDLDCRKSILMSCGLSARRYGLVQDVVVFVYDVRAKKTLPLLSVPSGAVFVRIHPKAPMYCVAVGPQGQLSWLDAKNPGSLLIKQAAVMSEIIGVDQNGTGDGLVLAESSGVLHYWTKTGPEADNDTTFGGLDVPSVMGPLPTVGPETPLSAVGMPYYNQELLSSWSDPSYVFEVGMACPDWRTWPALRALKHAPIGRNRRGSMPRFISQGGGGASESFASNGHDSSDGRAPRTYRQLRIQYSKFGIDDFDFQFFNATTYSGLEPLVESPHGNAVLQLMRWSAPLHNATLRLFAENNWDSSLVVVGELAVLFDMLHKANGRQCQAANLASTVLDSESVPLEPAPLAKYLLTRVVKESPTIGAQFAAPQTTRMYGSCGFRHDSTDYTLVARAKDMSQRSLGAALAATTESTAYCPKCDKRHTMATTKQLAGTPASLFFELENGNSEKQENPCTSFNLMQRADKRSYRLAAEGSLLGERYSLRGYVADIDGEHSVCCIKIGNDDEEGWHLFNDFCVTPVSAEEALDFTSDWKTPRLLMYTSANSSEFDYEEWKARIDTRLLHEPYFVSGNLEAPPPARLLSPGEDPPKVVALDAEFVLLDQEVAEIHSDGTKSLLQPRTLSLARVSVLRGDTRTSFIDDFVETRKDVVDYLTAYSGIEPGDLDPQNSPYGLVARQTATRRLWLLLNLGCMFVGHALYNDFRTINLVIPPSQILDTVDLYYSPELKGRRLSLKFLVWAVLGDQIQLGNHDSVEDALSALRLYERYKELEAEGKVDETLAEVVAKGQQTNFRVPIVP